MRKIKHVYDQAVKARKVSSTSFDAHHRPRVRAVVRVLSGIVPPTASASLRARALPCRPPAPRGRSGQPATWPSRNLALCSFWLRVFDKRQWAMKIEHSKRIEHGQPQGQCRQAAAEEEAAERREAESFMPKACASRTANWRPNRSPPHCVLAGPAVHVTGALPSVVDPPSSTDAMRSTASNTSTKRV